MTSTPETATVTAEERKATKKARAGARGAHVAREGHTCLTKWSQHIDPYTLAYFAGHSDFGTTRRYVHPNMESGRAAMERAGVAGGGHNSAHIPETTSSAQSEREALFQ